MDLTVLFWIVAAVLFGISIFASSPPRFSLVSAGLTALTIGFIFQVI